MLNRIRGRRRGPLDSVPGVAGDRRVQMFAAGAAVGLVVGRLTGWLSGRKPHAGLDARPDDVTLTQKVEHELFQPGDVPKSRIDVAVEDGVVRLRGEVERHELIDELESRTRRVEGVRDVENLVHLPTAVHG